MKNQETKNQSELKYSIGKNNGGMQSREPYYEGQPLEDRLKQRPFK